MSRVRGHLRSAERGSQGRASACSVTVCVCVIAAPSPAQVWQGAASPSSAEPDP